MTNPKFDSIFGVGDYHVQNRMICQDFAIAIQDGPLTILALSDGMGSCQHSEIGSRLAVSYIRNNARTIYEMLETSNNSKDNAFFREKLIDLLIEMGEEAYRESYYLGININDIHCTLSFAIIGPAYTIAVSIGDSPLYVKTNDKFFKLNGNGDLVDNITYSAFNFESDIIDVKICPTENLESILIMSDGCLGYEKEGCLEEMASDFPEWFYDIIQKKKTKYDVLKRLIAEGYDDCSFSYYCKC